MNTQSQVASLIKAGWKPVLEGDGDFDGLEMPQTGRHVMGWNERYGYFWCWRRSLSRWSDEWKTRGLIVRWFRVASLTFPPLAWRHLTNAERFCSGVVDDPEIPMSLVHEVDGVLRFKDRL